ncbi:MAG: S8 family serine peptidase [Bacteroidota bacterium]
MRFVIQLALAFLCLGSGLFAQSSSYYWADGKKITLQEDRSSMAIYFKDQMMPDRLTAPPQGKAQLFVNHQRGLVQYDEPQSSGDRQLATDLGITNDQIRSTSFGWTLDDGFSVWLTHEVVVMPYSQSDIGALQSMLEQYGASYLRQDYATHVLEVADINQVLPLANALQESGLVKWATPNLFAEVTHHADPLFGEQFQMNNTGQTIDGFPGTNDMDCNGPEAWAITLGSSNITVAVIDDGVEAHEDLVTGTGGTRVLGGYTPATNGNGTPNASGAHGEACAGIIAASHNGTGVQGVAPNVLLRSVNIFAGGETTQDIANGIAWAKNNGSDVLSNSWGYTSCTFTASNITSAISDAVTTGRGGLGCVVVFASGNGYKTCVDYPAYLSTVIAVGAFGNDGIKSDYSNSGADLDIAAPSNDINSNRFLTGAGVRTIDRMGSPGYSSGNYTTSFGGTSAACPVVAGVAALVLSVDPSLSDAQVKSILYSTANDMGTPGFDNLYGNGRVDAFAAVQAAGGGSGGSCSATVSSFPYSEGFESGEGWSQGSGDDMDWTRRSGSTPSSGTGPSGATEGTFYMYMETSNPNFPTKNAYFESPCFDLTGVSNPEFSFEYHMLGSAVGTLRLQASTDGSNWTTVWTLSGDQGSAWNSATVSLATYTSANELRLRFFGTSGTSWQGDMCVDDLRLNSGGSGGGCNDNEVTLTLTLDNYPGETTWEVSNGSSVVASGGPYTTAGATETVNLCLVDGCYDFTINDSYGDGICCSFGNGSYSLDGGGNNYASGGSFTSSETTNFCVGSGGGGACPAIDFNSYTITSYGNGQDAGSSAIQNGGATIFLQNNAWKDIAYPYTVTANTVIEFDFRSTLQGEIHGIGFDTDESLSSNLTFKVHGTQNWGITNYDNYSGSAWVTYQIPVGSFYTGSFSKLFFVADHDGGARNGNAYFRNVKVYEGSCPSSLAPALAVGNPIEIILGDEAEIGIDLYPSPTVSDLNVRVAGLAGISTWQITDLAGKVIARGAMAETAQNVDVRRLPAGLYMFKVTGENGNSLTKKFMKVKH